MTVQAGLAGRVCPFNRLAGRVGFRSGRRPYQTTEGRPAIFNPNGQAAMVAFHDRRWSRAMRRRHAGQVTDCDGGSAQNERLPGSAPHSAIRQNGVTAWNSGCTCGRGGPALRRATNTRPVWRVIGAPGSLQDRRDSPRAKPRRRRGAVRARKGPAPLELARALPNRHIPTAVLEQPVAGLGEQAASLLRVLHLLDPDRHRRRAVRHTVALGSRHHLGK
jgi:hypothetical protein